VSAICQFCMPVIFFVPFVIAEDQDINDCTCTSYDSWTNQYRILDLCRVFDALPNTIYRTLGKKSLPSATLAK
jgi:hypothetical protein